MEHHLFLNDFIDRKECKEIQIKKSSGIVVPKLLCRAGTGRWNLELPY